MKWSRDAIRTGLRRTLAALVVPAVLAGCAWLPPKPRHIELMKPFDQDQALLMLREGAGTINGSALVLHPYGGAQNCAGYPVVLVPATPYADERMSAAYGPGGQGIVWPPAPIFNPDVLAYQAASRTVTCGAKGDFKFDKVADGSYYVVAAVPWRPLPTSDVVQASIAQKVTLQGGKPLTIELIGRP